MADERQQIICDLVRQAATGARKLDWLHKAIIEAGYIRKQDRVTKREVRTTVRNLLNAVESIACDCAETCGEHMLDKVIRFLQQVQAAEGDEG